MCVMYKYPLIDHPGTTIQQVGLYTQANLMAWTSKVRVLGRHRGGGHCVT